MTGGESQRPKTGPVNGARHLKNLAAIKINSGAPTRAVIAPVASSCGATSVRAAISASTSASANAERSRHALDALVEANVRAQFARLLESEPVQTVLASGRPLSLHGCVYDLASGHLTTLVEHLSPQEHAP